MATRIIKEDLTADRLRELLNYDRETGVFSWLVSCRGTRAGDIAGTSSSEGRRHIIIGYARYKAHRLAWLYVYGEFPKKLIDHINGDPTDNRIANLREATMSENLHNQRRAHKNNKTGILGVQWRASKNKFRARIVTDGKETHLGYFDTSDEAQKAYLEAKSRLHQFAPK
ncbi:MAG: HNH endonuclease [Verrucomicrobia bacterium]|nr:HNH endonuclease [Verrucomicrobiota bacterium]